LHHVFRRVLADLEFVADDGELGVEVLSGDVGVDHPVGFEVERPVEVLVGRRERLEVVRAVVIGRAIGARAVSGQLVRNVGMLRRPLEHHVLEQVRHPRFAVPFVPRADEVRDVDRRVVFRRIGEQQHVQPVGELVLGDPFDRSHLRRLGLGASGGLGGLPEGLSEIGAGHRLPDLGDVEFVVLVESI
jgi:hypothetical protein